MNDIPESTPTQVLADELDLLPGRLLQVIAFAGITQAELARRVGMSAGFISDVARGTKRPGPELLVAMRKALGVSIDWLLCGEGTMTGGAGIRNDLFQTIRLQVAVARAAVMDQNATAKALLTLIQEGHVNLSSDDKAFRELLEQLVPLDDDLQLILQLYNGHQWGSDPISQRRNIISAAISHFETKRPFDRLSAVAGVSSGSTVNQVISGRGHRVAGGSYTESKRSKR